MTRFWVKGMARKMASLLAPRHPGQIVLEERDERDRPTAVVGLLSGLALIHFIIIRDSRIVLLHKESHALPNCAGRIGGVGPETGEPS
jgi:hypothetical protein